jgi:hypothetical protein
MWRTDFTFSKRLLGAVLLALGLLAAGGIIAVDLLDVGREGGIGPAQQLALVVSASLVLLGASLIPLGNDPA